jgi:2-haloacid dehalogenase
VAGGSPASLGGRSRNVPCVIVTFDLFSALTDSRTGASRLFAELADERGWDADGPTVYDVWDRHNKALQRDARPPVTFHDLSRSALERAYEDLGFSRADVDADLERIESSVADWPLWPDVEGGVRAAAELAGVGLLSNVDDALARRTRAHALVDPALVLSSQRLGAYKPSPQIYHAAVAAAAPERLVHVAASGRDVRGALEAGIAVVRLVRPGHVLDADGPRPAFEIDDASDLPSVLARI